jgi:hypothetical protein
MAESSADVRQALRDLSAARTLHRRAERRLAPEPSPPVPAAAPAAPRRARAAATEKEAAPPSSHDQKALDDMEHAREIESRARRRIARTSRPGGPVTLVDPEWEWAESLLEARREKLMAYPGVIGCGLGFRLRRGKPTERPCITVLVERKLAEEELRSGGHRRLPRTVRSRHQRLQVDVVEMGEVRRQLSGGASIGPILAQATLTGTLGAFATDLDHGDTVALTAMHVTGLQDFPVTGCDCPSFCSPGPPPAGPAFGTLRQGTMTGIDAAKIALSTQQPAVTELPTIGEIQGWRPTAFPGDQGTVVRLFGAVSGFQQGFIVNPAVAMPSAQLDSAILANINTQAGDSGCALVDEDNLLLGFLVGQGTLRVFTPASLVLPRLRCDIPDIPKV